MPREIRSHHTPTPPQPSPVYGERAGVRGKRGQLNATSKPRLVPGRAIIASYQRLTLG